MNNKKRTIIIIFIFTILGILLISKAKPSKQLIYNDYDGVLLAIGDGNGGTLSSVPSKGFYDVDVDCTNAEGSWDYNNWKLVVKNVKGNVSCEINFSSVNSAPKLSSYIISLAGTNQGTGKVIHEMSRSVPNSASTFSSIAQSGYIMTTPYYSDAMNGDNPTQQSSAASWNSTNSYWKTNPTIVDKIYHFVYNVANAGYYKACYKKISGGNEDKLYIYKNSSTLFPNESRDYLTSTTEECINVGYVSTADVIHFYQFTGDNDYASLAISLKKTSDLTSYDTGYRYEGKNPNNYVWFNDELWRIIGVFNSDRHGVDGMNLVKIIRDESIGGYAWNGVSTESNDWTTSTLYRMLNGCYFNALIGTNTTNISGSNVACSNYCVRQYITTSSITGVRTSNCDFSVSGIQNSGVDYGYRDMVQNVTWYLGGPEDSARDSMFPDEVYSNEMDNSKIYPGRPASVTGYVGLMYLSDYGFASLGSSCTRGVYSISTQSNEDYRFSECVNNNWLYGSGVEHTITPNSRNNASFANNSYYIESAGFVTDGNLNDSKNVRPVIFLKNSIYKLSGTGTKTDPYILGKGYEYDNTFNYSSSVQTLQIVKGGYYKFEVWGAAGGNGYNSTTYYGGLGGYATGVVHLNANDILYIHTGGAGKGSSSNGVQPGGTNGGGATDIRINTDSLYARVIVAGGGGGGAYRANYFGGSGGGANGVGATGGDGSGYNTTYNAKGGGTTSGGAGGSYNGGNYKGSDGTFGNGGAAATSTTTNYGRSGGGGGGWYGGGGGGYRASSSYYYYGQSGGGGGSSYTYSAATASQVPSGWLLGSEYQMTSTSTNGGNSSDGIAKVTYCGQSASDCS